MRVIRIFGAMVLALVGVMSVSAQTLPDANGFRLEPVAEGFTRALYVTHANDDSGRLFVVQQNGIIHTLTADGVRMPAPFLDLSAQISADALGTGYTERGLLGLAFHPNYAENGQFFVNYTENGNHATVLMRYTVSPTDSSTADPTTGEELMRISQPYANHNGGHIAFGPDGYLYMSVGDGGSAGDPLNSGQQPTTLLGSILRLDVDSAPDTDAGLAYAIPADNPFAGVDTGADEVWAYGLRNVWRFSFDPLNGDLYIGDVGQNVWEEINVQPDGIGGLNFGWKVMEASHPYTGEAAPAGSVLPVAEYRHENGHCSVTGGYVYRGETVPALDGAYLFGDFCSGQLWATVFGPSGWETAPLVDTPYTVSSFGTDGDGELYLVHYGTNRPDGVVYRFVAN